MVRYLGVGLPGVGGAAPGKGVGALNVLRNSTVAGAAVGTPGTLPTYHSFTTLRGLSREVVAVNAPTSWDLRIFGTATSSGGVEMIFEANNTVVAATGQVWTNAVSFAKIAGAFTNLSALSLLCAEYKAAAAYNGELHAAVNLLAMPGTLQRYRASGTVDGPGGSISLTPYLQFNLLNGAVIDFTIRISAPLLAIGDWPTA